MLLTILYKSSIFVKDSTLIRTIKLLFICIIIYGVLYFVMNSKYIENIKQIQDYKQYIYYIVGIDMISFVYFNLTSNTNKKKKKTKKVCKNKKKNVKKTKAGPIMNLKSSATSSCLSKMNDAKSVGLPVYEEKHIMIEDNDSVKLPIYEPMK